MGTRNYLSPRLQSAVLYEQDQHYGLKGGKKLLIQILFWRAITHFNDGDPRVRESLNISQSLINARAITLQSRVHVADYFSTVANFRKLCVILKVEVG